MSMQRRLFLALVATGSAVAAAPGILQAEVTSPPAGGGPDAAKTGASASEFVQPPLPFADGALAPVISQETVRIHYGKHHAGYYANLNRLIRDRPDYRSLALPDVVKRAAANSADQAILNQAGQALNHEIYWAQFKPGGAKAPEGALRARIETDLGGIGTLRDRLIAAAGGVFGSGWAWLVQEPDGRLAVATTPNGDSPLGRDRTPLLAIDVWEHAYYIDYRNRRTDHVGAVFDTIVNWDVVGQRLKAA
jgi:Fe-Mn family superoxide dismutase